MPHLNPVASLAWRGMAILTLALALIAVAGHDGVRAEADPFTVADVDVDVTAADASVAKMKAIGEAQVKAFHRMVERLATREQADRMRDLDAATIGRLMASLRIQNERTGPNRYIARLTISFLPDKVRELLDRYDVRRVEEQAPPVTMLPLWIGEEKPLLWEEENPWRRAWLRLDLRNSITPVTMPLGDLADISMIGPIDVLNEDRDKFEAIAERYRTEHVLIAAAEQTARNEIEARLIGISAVGRIDLHDRVRVEDGNVEAAARVLAGRLLSAMEALWKERGGRPMTSRAPTESVMVAIPFGSLAEWNTIRGRLLSMPGVADLETETLSSTGAVVRLQVEYDLESFRYELSQFRYGLTRIGDIWVLQPL